MAKIFLVRHAKAGERRLWNGPDIERPLSKKGWRQSELLAKKLAKVPATALFSSPYVRCSQTLEPLARRLGLDIAISDALEEYQPAGPVLELIGDVPDGSVLCSHGDIIPAAIAAIKKGGAELKGKPDWRKTSTWVLKRNKHGTIVQARVIPPPVH